MRGVPRWVAVLAVVAAVVAVSAFSLHRVLTPAAILVEAPNVPIPADGFASAEFKLHSSTGRDLHGLRVEVDDPRRAAVESVVVSGGTAVVRLRSGVIPGAANLQITAPGFEPREMALHTTLDASDSVGDGTPDFLRLHDAADQAAFRRWFTLLAESEFYRRPLPAEIADCAALLRYAYRESLSRHDAAWAKAVALVVAPAADDVRQYQYPYTPLGAGLFRIRDGSFAADDFSNGTFAQFADAKTLWRYNSYFVGRDIARARSGDLLFFRQKGHGLPFHAMIFLGASQIEAEDGHEPLVIYHTGPVGESAGEIRRPTLAQLMSFPDPRWRPVPSNPSFLGVYRWNILRGAD
jgi:uncharacterized protein YfaT (DUF1175 family)